LIVCTCACADSAHRENARAAMAQRSLRMGCLLLSVE
jgi:hypothetical protein